MRILSTGKAEVSTEIETIFMKIHLHELLHEE